MVYDLRGDGERLTLTMSPRASSQDPDEWHVEASASTQADAVRVDRWARTRAEALHAVGLEWCKLALPRFDWEAVRVVLAEVRAV